MLDELKAAEHAARKAHEALREAARLNTDAERLLDAHGLTLRRLASDLNELHATEAESAYLETPDA